MSDSLSILTLCSMTSSARIHFDFSAPVCVSFACERSKSDEHLKKKSYPVSLNRFADAECDFDAPFLPTDIVLIIIKFGEDFNMRFLKAIIFLFQFFLFFSSVKVKPSS